MQVAAVTRKVIQEGAEASGSFAISQKNQAHVMRILRDHLYTDKILAVLREYASNAWDAHQVSGKGRVPIKVTLPTDLNPVLVIRDFGTGMSEEEVFGIFTQYGDSTKRDDNRGVGMLGIGSKSAFAYSDTFTVISYHGGMKRTYVAVLDETDVGTMSRMCEEPCGEEVGLEVQVPVRRKDIPAFCERAKTLFQHFKPRPDINLAIPVVKRMDLKEGFVMEDHSSPGGQWVAVMGCIPYRINLSQVQEALEKARLWQVANRTSGGIFFKIGEVQISANREELKYDDKTKDAIVERIALVLHGYLKEIIKALETGKGMTAFARRLKVRDTVARLQGSDLLLPPEFRDLAVDRVPLWTDMVKAPKTFTMMITNVSHGDVTVSALPVRSDLRLVLKDDSRNIKGFRLNIYHADYVVRPFRNSSIEDVEKELDAYLERAGMTGVEKVKISTLPWQQHYVGNRSSDSTDPSKWGTRTFRLIRSQGHHRFPWSSNWEIVKGHVPSDQDVFVIIKDFQPVATEPALRGAGFFGTFQRDCKLMEALGGTMPVVFGYKSTSSHPITEADCKGMSYAQWRRDILMKMPMPQDLVTDYMNMQWADIIPETWRFDILRRDPENLIKTLEFRLGTNHPIIEVLRKVKDARMAMMKIPPGRREIFSSLSDLYNFSSRPNPALTAWKALEDAYPMLVLSDDFCHLWGDGDSYCLPNDPNTPPKKGSKAYRAVSYVKTMDRMAALEKAVKDAGIEV